jgi:hypothetical protein
VDQPCFLLLHGHSLGRLSGRLHDVVVRDAASHPVPFLSSSRP